MFAPAIGIKEDPVAGNANGPLGGYLVQNKMVACSANQFEFNGLKYWYVTASKIMDEIKQGIDAPINIEKGLQALIIYSSKKCV